VRTPAPRPVSTSGGISGREPFIGIGSAARCALMRGNTTSKREYSSRLDVFDSDPVLAHEAQPPYSPPRSS
jgi:hypothetical protein